MTCISVLISTLNRCEYLKDALSSLDAQRYPAGMFEIIVVDNGSNDRTKELVAAFQQEHGVQTQYLFEPVKGLSKARNTGMQAANFPWVAILDDDAVAQPDWLASFADAIRKDDEGILALGGMIDLQWDVLRPKWFPAELEGYLGSNTVLGQAGFDFPPNKYPYGGNIVLRKDAALEVGGFDTSYGRVGGSLRTGEESRIIEQLRPKGRIVYVPQALVHHRVPAFRATRRYMLERAFHQGRADAKLDQARQPRSRFGLLRSAAANLLFSLRNFLKFAVLALSGSNQAAFTTLFNGMVNLGRSVQCSRLIFENPSIE